MGKSRVFIFNRCIHREKDGRGVYIGLENPIFDIDTFFFPWVRNDGCRGFVEWLIFRFGWYPVPKRDKTEISAYERKMMLDRMRE